MEMNDIDNRLQIGDPWFSPCHQASRNNPPLQHWPSMISTPASQTFTSMATWHVVGQDVAPKSACWSRGHGSHVKWPNENMMMNFGENVFSHVFFILFSDPHPFSGDSLLIGRWNLGLHHPSFGQTQMSKRSGPAIVQTGEHVHTKPE
jgi:hypothetical protein